MSALPDAAEVAARVVEVCERASQQLEFATFKLGVRAHPDWEAAATEEELFAWKRQIKLTAGMELERRWSEREANFQRPEVLFVYDGRRERAELSIRSLYLYARYRKLERGIPQTRAPWRHEACGGQGCAACEQTGKEYPTSVEQLLGDPCAEAFGAKEALLHGCGREDIDVRCLGAGRPFVLELREPKRRSLDLEALLAAVNAHAAGRAEVARPFQLVAQSVVGRVKSSTSDKRYLARCQATDPLEAAAVAGLREALSGRVLEQRTPERVAHRRADLVRERTVHSFAPGALSDDALAFSAEIHAQSGTYIKELISSDGGRTTPSVAGLLGQALTCVELDVLAVEAEDAAFLGA